MDDLDHVLKYLREEYQYQIWALVGHSRGKCLTLAMLIEGANAAFHYIIMRDRSIPLIVNCSGRFMSELLKTRIESFYPGGLQSGSYIETWALPGGKTRERRTPAEEIISLSNTDNKMGTHTHFQCSESSRAITSVLLCFDDIWVSRSCNPSANGD